MFSLTHTVEGYSQCSIFTFFVALSNSRAVVQVKIEVEREFSHIYNYIHAETLQAMRIPSTLIEKYFIFIRFPLCTSDMKFDRVSNTFIHRQKKFSLLYNLL